MSTTAAVILASGPGTRLGELGTRTPKTMLPVAGRPYLEHLASWLLTSGIRPVVVAVHHLAHMIVSHFADDDQWSDVVFVTTGQRGTGADLLDCIPHVPTDTLIVWNGDTVVSLDTSALLSHAQQDPRRGVVVLTRRPDVPNHGAFYVGHDGTVLASMEAIPPPTVPQRHAWRGSSTGVLVLRKPLLERFRPGRSPVSLEQTIVPALITTGHLRAYDNGTNYFLDFGTPERLAQLHRDAPSLFARE